ncbi:Uncharacterized protein ChrSV_4464 [Chromobacterium vaccinii]|nr:Uncharacterized protein ChrSW_4464 [Chromobacterium vaccinii]QND91920.1 Uncharacterized protein ChrSV_4464 [Chromobacterium vaccinii]
MPNHIKICIAANWPELRIEIMPVAALSVQLMMFLFLAPGYWKTYPC